jgi:putative intracellular protease/amidase
VKPDDAAVAEFLADVGDRLSHTPAVHDVDAADYQAVYLVGGHGTMWDFPESKELASLIARIYEEGGVVAAVCHGPAGLINVRIADGTHLVDGRRVSCFTNEEESAVGLTDVVPFALESKLAEQGARITKTDNFAEQAVADQRLITGQNPASAASVAALAVEELREREPR